MKSTKLIALFICCNLIGLLTNSLVAQTAQGKFEYLGGQIHSATIQGTAFVQYKGNDYLFTVVRGRPAHLIGYNLTNNKLIIDKELHDTDGSWALSASSDGTVYIASAQGYLFKHKPETQIVENLGRFQNEKLIWDLVPGEKGEMFGGTYPGCIAFRYHPNEGFQEISNGAAVPNQQYAQFLSYNKETKKLYVGTYVGADVVEIDTKTKDKKYLFNEEYKNNGSLYNLRLVDTPNGKKLLVWLNHIGVGRETLVINSSNHQLEQVLPSMEVRFLEQTKDSVYFPVDNKLFVAPINNLKKSKKIYEFQGKIKASRKVNKNHFQFFSSEGLLIDFNCQTHKTTTIQYTIPAQPIDIQSMFFGPDKKLWMGGYLAGGHATYDPVTNTSKEYYGMHQTEGMSALGDTLYFGVYSGAKIYKYDTKATWDLKNANPKLLTEIKGQSRPFANLAIDSLNRVYFATVPSYGVLGGAVTMYDANQHKFTVFDTIFPGQSPVSLVLRDGKIWGGTTISGGLGVKPTQSECKLFCFDPSTNSLVYYKSPLPNNMAITALMNGPDGNLWGMSDGELFIFDTKTEQIIYKQKIYDFNRQRTHIWIDGNLLTHKNGKIYGTGGSKLFEINPKNMQINILKEGVGLLAQDNLGSLYFRGDAFLWKYTPEQPN